MTSAAADFAPPRLATDMTVQGQKLMANLGFVVQGLRKPAAMLPALEELANRPRLAHAVQRVAILERSGRTRSSWCSLAVPIRMKPATRSLSASLRASFTAGL